MHETGWSLPLRSNWREETRTRRNITRAMSPEIVADDAKMRVQIEAVPVVLAEDTQTGFGLQQRVNTLACDGVPSSARFYRSITEGFPRLFK
jgi:hypothetical protein